MRPPAAARAGPGSRPAGLSRCPGWPPISYLSSFFAFSGSVSPSPYAGQSGAIGQAPQAGLRAWQIAAAVEDDAVREHRPLALGEERGDLRLDLLRVLLRGPLPAPHQPPEVGVHGEARHAEGVAEHHIGRLAARRRAASPGPPGGPGTSPPKRSAQRRGQARAADLALARKKPVGPDQLLQLLRVGGGHVLGRRVRGEERGRRLVDPQVGGLGGQDRGDQQLEGVLEVQLGVGVRIDLGELAVDPAGAADQRGPGLGAGGGFAAASGADGFRGAAFFAVRSAGAWPARSSRDPRPSRAGRIGGLTRRRLRRAALGRLSVRPLHLPVSCSSSTGPLFAHSGIRCPSPVRPPWPVLSPAYWTPGQPRARPPTSAPATGRSAAQSDPCRTARDRPVRQTCD